MGQESKGKNPICDLHNYTITLKMYCLYLNSLDGISVSSQTVPAEKPKYPAKEVQRTQLHQYRQQEPANVGIGGQSHRDDAVIISL